MKSGVAWICAVMALTVLVTGNASGEDTDRQYTSEKFKSDVTAAGKGIKDAAVNAGRQIGAGSTKAYRDIKNKIKQDLGTARPVDGGSARKNGTAPDAVEGRN